MGFVLDSSAPWLVWNDTHTNNMQKRQFAHRGICGVQFFQGNAEGRSDCSAAFCRRSCFTSGGVVSLFLELHFLVWFNWNFRKHPLRELQVSVREA